MLFSIKEGKPNVYVGSLPTGSVLRFRQLVGVPYATTKIPKTCQKESLFLATRQANETE